MAMWALISASYFNRLSIKLISLFSGLNEPLQHPIRNSLSVVLRETLQVQENNICFYSHQRNQKIKKWRVVDVLRNVLQRLLHLWQKAEKKQIKFDQSDQSVFFLHSELSECLASVREVYNLISFQSLNCLRLFCLSPS